MIDIEGLSKRYGRGGERTPALSGIDLSVGGGEAAALIGENGVGKSTLIRILSTLLRPDSGRATVAGLDVVRQASRVRQLIGVALQDPSVYPSARVDKILLLHAQLHGLSRSAASRRRDELIDLMELGKVTGRKTRSLSGGMRRRLDLCLALVHQPPVLLLDEPTANLDPESRHRFWQELSRLRDRGTCVLMATQNMDEARGLADRAIVLRDGAIDPEENAAAAAREMAVDVHVG